MDRKQVASLRLTRSSVAPCRVIRQKICSRQTTRAGIEIDQALHLTPDAGRLAVF